jgi:nifR3 family TIM-barrel protein
MTANDLPVQFYVRDIPVKGDLILAPMDGISSYPFRSLTRSYGSAMSYTEFISAVDAFRVTPRIKNHIFFTEEERPVVFQLLDNDVDRLTRAAANLMAFKPDIIDINLGCPAKDIANRGAGAGLLRDPEKIKRLFSSLSTAVPVPLTAKIRLGWDESLMNYLEIACAIEENGGALIAVHGRTQKQGYSGKANWDAIAAVKQAVSIPVLANGDVRTVADIEQIKAQTGCDGVMIGRAALQNPWIFSRRDRESISTSELLSTITEHLNRNVNFLGEEQGLIRFRKHLLHYLKSDFELSAELRLEMLTTLNLVRFNTLLNSIFQERGG